MSEKQKYIEKLEDDNKHSLKNIETQIDQLPDLIEKQFSKMKKLKEEIEEMNLEYAPCHELSMGMSNDYKLALKYGATTIRIGRFFLE